MNQFVPSHYSIQIKDSMESNNNNNSIHHQFIDKDLISSNSNIHYSSPININHGPIISHQQPNIEIFTNNNSPQIYSHPSLFHRSSPPTQSKQNCILPKFQIDTSKCLNNYHSSPNSPNNSNNNNIQSNSSLVPTLNVNTINNSPVHYNTPIESFNSNNTNTSNNNNNNNDIPISTCIPLLKLKSLSSQSSNGSSQCNIPQTSSNSPRSIYYVPECELSPFITPTQSPRNQNPISHSTNNNNNNSSFNNLSSQQFNSLYFSSNNNISNLSSQSSSLSNTPLSSPRGSNNNSCQIDKIEEHWRKLEWFTKDLTNFVSDSLKSLDFTGFQELSEKVEDVKNSIKEIEIINSIAKTLPPQTRARKKRSTKAEKLQKDRDSNINPIVKRTYVTTPKAKGNHCAQCGTLETPEWRKGPGGHKTLCNACGLHYAKNLKRENINKKMNITASINNNIIDSPNSGQMSINNNNMKIQNLLE